MKNKRNFLKKKIIIIFFICIFLLNIFVTNIYASSWKVTGEDDYGRQYTITYTYNPNNLTLTGRIEIGGETYNVDYINNENGSFSINLESPRWKNVSYNFRGWFYF